MRKFNTTKLALSNLILNPFIPIIASYVISMIFAVLKLAKIISWSWNVVLLPIFIALVITVFIMYFLESSPTLSKLLNTKE